MFTEGRVVTTFLLPVADFCVDGLEGADLLPVTELLRFPDEIVLFAGRVVVVLLVRVAAAEEGV